MANHRIRLGPPWDVTADAGRTRHARKFGRPRLQHADERTWLVCDAIPAAAEVFMNGELLAAVEAGPFAFDVSSRLQPRNEVVIAVSDDEPIGEVALEMRAIEYLE